MMALLYTKKKIKSKFSLPYYIKILFDKLNNFIIIYKVYNKDRYNQIYYKKANKYKCIKQKSVSYQSILK